jgi:tripartite-type tricarboxylate transporter receptor subunit TctC
MERRRTLAASVAAALVIRPVRAQPADSWPTRPIRLIVPWPPGGPVDTAARPVATRLSEALGQPVVVESRAGANGTIGAGVVAAAPPDGYTLLVASPGPVLINPIARGGRGAEEILAAFAPVGQIVSSPSVLVVRPDLPVRALPELIAHARPRPGELTYGSAGPASINHLTGALLAQRAGVSLLHVPYQGATPLMNDLLAGRIDMAFIGVAAALPHVRSGAIRALAVGNPRRARALPEVPTVADTLPGFQADNWYAILAPAQMPRAVAARLHRALAAVLAEPQLAHVLTDAGYEPAPSESPEALAAMMREDLGRWAEAVRAAGLRPD